MASFLPRRTAPPSLDKRHPPSLDKQHLPLSLDKRCSPFMDGVLTNGVLPPSTNGVLPHSTASLDEQHPPSLLPSTYLLLLAFNSLCPPPRSLGMFTRGSIDGNMFISTYTFQICTLERMKADYSYLLLLIQYLHNCVLLFVALL
jgi:hypothetical protein